MNGTTTITTAETKTTNDNNSLNAPLNIEICDGEKINTSNNSTNDISVIKPKSSLLSGYSEKTEEQKKLDRIKRFGIIESKVEEESRRPTFKNVLLQNYNYEKYSEKNKDYEGKNKINPGEESEQVESIENIERKKLHIFGVNLMKSRDIEDYFSLFQMKKLYWINDFSCIVEFDNEEFTEKAYEYYTGTKLPDNPECKDYLEWKKIFEYDVKGDTQKLEMRYAVKSVNYQYNIYLKDFTKKLAKGQSEFSKYCEDYKYKKQQHRRERSRNYKKTILREEGISQEKKIIDKDIEKEDKPKPKLWEYKSEEGDKDI